MMNLFKTAKLFSTALCLGLLTTSLSSCDSRGEETPEGDSGLVTKADAKVTINLLGSVPLSEANQMSGSSLLPSSLSASLGKATPGASHSMKDGTQTQVVALDQNVSVIATLVPADTEESMTLSSQSLSASSVKSSVPSPKAATTGPVQTPLETGVRYRVIVYNKATGAQVANKEYVYGQESITPGFVLDGGTEYTFIAYSINSKASGTAGLPATPTGNLSSATLSNITGDLMYFKKDMVIKKGDNYLNVVLVHQFSKITTIVELTPETRGYINEINTALFSGARVNGSLKLSNAVITYGANKTAGDPVVFPAIPSSGLRTVQSTPTLLISPTVTNASLKIGATTTTGQQLNTSLTNNMTISNLNIKPGHKYNLILKFVVPCVDNVDVSNNNLFNWDSRVSGQQPGTRTVYANAANFGFVFDIIELDNSFNMTINDTKLLNRNSGTNNNELQFEVVQDATQRANYPLNIMFADGDEYHQFENNPLGWNDPKSIWNIVGTAQKPALRIVINAQGKVSIYGSKVSGGDLYPLALKSGWSFNTITWKTTAQNKITISQNIQNVTVMRGNGYGKKTIVCP